MNCGRCGRPIYQPGQPICQGCRKVLVSDHSKYAERENKKADLQTQMYDSMAGESNEDDDKYDLDFWGLSEKDRDYKKRSGKRR